MTGLNHEKFEAALADAAAEVGDAEALLKEKHGNLQRLARAANATGMSERQIARAAARSGPAVHAWLKATPKDGN